MPWTFFDKYGQKRVNSGMAMASQILAYQEFQGVVPITATTEAAGNTIVTAPAIVSDGITPIIVESFIPQIIPGPTANSYIYIALWDGASPIGNFFQEKDGTAIATGGTGHGYFKRRLVPTAGSHVYSVRGMRGVSDGSVQGGAGGAAINLPGYIQVSRADWAVYNPGAVPKITTSLLSGGPPVNPQDNDIWIATGVDSFGGRWTFQYDLADSSAYKWKFIGGTPITSLDTTGNNNGATINTWFEAFGSSANRIGLARAGDYLLRGFWRAQIGGSSAATMTFGFGTSAGAWNASGDYTTMADAAGYGISVAWELPVRGLTIANPLTLWFQANLASCIVTWSRLEVLPIRIS